MLRHIERANATLRSVAEKSAARTMTEAECLPFVNRSWVYASKNARPPVVTQTDKRDRYARRPKGEAHALQREVEPAESDGAALERLVTSREARHNAALDVYDTAVEDSFTRLSAALQAQAAALAEALRDSSDEADRVLAQFADGQFDASLSVEQLDSVFARRAEFVASFESSIEVELEELADKAGSEMRSLAMVLTDVAFMIPSDVTRVLEERAETANTRALSTRRDVKHMVGVLEENNVLFRRRTLTRLEELAQERRKSQFMRLLDKLRERVRSRDYVQPLTRDSVIRAFVDDARRLVERRTAVLSLFGSLVPPHGTVASVRDTCDELTNVLDVLRKSGETFERSFRADLVHWRQKYLTLESTARRDLLAIGYVDDAAVMQFVSGELSAFLRARESSAQTLCDDSVRIFWQQYRDIRTLLESFMQFFSHSVQMVHDNVAEIEALDDSVAKTIRRQRRRAQTAADALEGELSATMQLIASAKDPNDVQAHLEKAIELLDKIEEVFRALHTDQVATAEQHVADLDALLARFRDAALEHFHCRDADVASAPTSAPPEPVAAPAATAAKPKAAPAKAAAKVEAAPAAAPAETTPVERADDDIHFVHVREKWFSVKLEFPYIPSDFAPREITSFPRSPYGEVVILPDRVPNDVLSDLYTHLRRAFFDYMLSHTESCLAQARGTLESRRAIFAHQFSSFLRSHAPRRGNVESRVGDKRLTELSNHELRTESFMHEMNYRNNLRSAAIDAMIAELRASLDHFKADVDQTNEVLRCFSSQSIERIQRMVQQRHAAFKDSVAARRDAVQAEVAKAKEWLAARDAAFIESCTLIQSGGTYNEDERSRFAATLQTFEANVASAYDGTLAALATAATETVDASSVFADALLKRLGNHHADAAFLEAITAASRVKLSVANFCRKSETQANRVRALVSWLEENVPIVVDSAEALLAPLATPRIADPAAASYLADVVADNARAAKDVAHTHLTLMLRSLRLALHERALVLGCGKRTAASVQAVSVLGLDEAPFAEVQAFEAALQQISKEELSNIQPIVTAYFAAKGDRAPTRPKLIAATAPEFTAAHEAMIKRETSATKDFVAASTKEFGEQVAAVSRLLPYVGRSVFARAREFFDSDVRLLRLRDDGELTRVVQMSSREKDEHIAALKPALGAPSMRAALDSLRDAELERCAALAQRVTGVCEHQRAESERLVVAGTQCVADSARAVLALLDQMVRPEHLLEATEKAELDGEHKNLRRLIRDRERLAKRAAVPQLDVPAAPLGAALCTPPLVLGADGTPLPAPEPFTPPADVAARTSAGTCADTLAHRSTVQARDRIVRDVAAAHAQAMLDLRGSWRALCVGIGEWRQRWLQLVEQIVEG